MKYIAVVLLSLCSFSCVTFKQFDSKAETARDPAYEAFMMKKDGTLISGKSLKHKNHNGYDAHIVKVTGKNNAFNLDGVNYNDSNFVVFQDRSAYHKQYNYNWIIRLVKGKLNLYYFDDMRYVMGKRERVTSFFLETKEGVIKPINIGNLRDAIKSNPKALKMLNSYYPKSNYIRELNVEHLADVVNVFNQD